MDSAFSKTQIDKLGDRLRAGIPSEDDLRMLDSYRRTFGAPYEEVVGTIRDDLGFEPTGRPAKSTSSIREKLIRESIRLSQIQDIAGCRIIVEDISAQDRAVERMISEFETVTKVDRRLNPSFGYRAIHLIVRQHGKLIEVQCRTELQHLWSQLSESLADVFDPALKYGGGPDDARRELLDMSSLVARIESLETRTAISIQGDVLALRKDLKVELKRIIDELTDAP